MKVRHWVYRFIGDYDGLVEDMNKIVNHYAPGLEIINVQRTNTSTGLAEGDYEYLIYTRQPIE